MLKELSLQVKTVVDIFRGYLTLYIRKDIQQRFKVRYIESLRYCGK